MTLTLRLEDSMHDALKVVADTEGVSVTTVIRDAIDDLLDKRAADPDFQSKLQAADERRRAALELLHPAVRTRMAAAESIQRQTDVANR